MHHQSHQLQQVPNMYGEPLPTSVHMGYAYDLPMRASYENDGFPGPHPGFAPQNMHMDHQMKVEQPMTFFIDDR